MTWIKTLVAKDRKYKVTTAKEKLSTGWKKVTY